MAGFKSFGSFAALLSASGVIPQESNQPTTAASVLPMDKHQDIRHLAQVRPSYDETQSDSEEAEDEFCIGDKVGLV